MSSLYICNRKKYHGFTLVELLVVISIIGVLSTLLVLQFGDTRAKARDAKRLYDVAVFEKAITAYEIEHGYYPLFDTMNDGQTPLCDSTTLCALSVNYQPEKFVQWSVLEEALKNYIMALPEDPINVMRETGEPWDHTTTHLYEYQVYSDGNGKQKTRWLDVNTCRFVDIEPEEGIPFRASIQLEFLETPKGNIPSLCKGTDVEGYDYDYASVILFQ